MDIQCIGFIFKLDRHDNFQEIHALIRAASGRGIRCAMAEEALSLFREDGAIGFDGETPELLLSIGGDGTILHSAEMASRLDIPVLGMNFGRLGFLSEIRFEDFGQALDRIASGSYFIDERTMFECSAGQDVRARCLNEFVLYKYPYEGVAHIRILVNGLQAVDLFGDGVIVSTATGATGYSISAGGPLIAPGLDVAIITPICPHTLHARPIVCPRDAAVELELPRGAYLCADGRQVCELAPGEKVRVGLSQYTTKFIRFTKRNLYQLIREKLT